MHKKTIITIEIRQDGYVIQPRMVEEYGEDIGDRRALTVFRIVAVHTKERALNVVRKIITSLSILDLLDKQDDSLVSPTTLGIINIEKIELPANKVRYNVFTYNPVEQLSRFSTLNTMIEFLATSPKIWSTSIDA